MSLRRQRPRDHGWCGVGDRLLDGGQTGGQLGADAFDAGAGLAFRRENVLRVCRGGCGREVARRFCRLKFCVAGSLGVVAFRGAAALLVGIVDGAQQVFKQMAQFVGRAVVTAAVGRLRLPAVLLQGRADLRVAELPVDFRAVERIAVLGENDALRVEGSAAHLKFCGNPFAPQCGRQLWPVAAAGYGVVQCLVYLVFRLSGSRRRCSLTCSLPAAK